MILDEVYQFLKKNYPIEDRKISDFQLGYYFTIVQLDDNSVGAAASYYQCLSRQQLSRVQEKLKHKCADWPLLFLNTQKALQPADLDLDQDLFLRLNASLKTALISALSEKFILSNHDPHFNLSLHVPFDIARGISKAVVIGFGGYMETLVNRPNVQQVHIADLQYQNPVKKSVMDVRLAHYRQLKENMQITISDGHDNREKIQQAELVCITGSALCNQTLEQLLAWSKNCTRVVVQGQSALIHPYVLFQKNVDLVTTSLIPAHSLLLSRNDPGGCLLKSVFENNQHKVFFTPKKNQQAEPGADPDFSAKIWFYRYHKYNLENGYQHIPLAIYRDFLSEVDRAGKIIELGCGNGLLLKFLMQHSLHALEPFGVDCRAQMIRNARHIIFPERDSCFECEKIENYQFKTGIFDLIIANPLSLKQDGQMQNPAKINAYYPGSALSLQIKKWINHLTEQGKLILFCYQEQWREIASGQDYFYQDLLPFIFREKISPSGALLFWIYDQELLKNAQGKTN